MDNPGQNRFNHPSSRTFGASREDVLIVYKGGVRVGTLIREANQVVFSYSTFALKNGHYLSESMTQDETYVSRGKEVPAFFANLLPEGPRRDAIASSLHISPDDEFELLCVLGADTIGDVVAKPADIKAHPLIPTIAVSEGVLKEETVEQMFREASNVDSQLFDPTSIPGMQKKVSRLLKNLNINSPGSGHRAQVFRHMMFKVSDDRYPLMVENERHFMFLANLCGIKTPKNLVLTDKHGNSVFVIERFDRVPIGPNQDNRVHVEDGCQLLGKRPEEKYNSSFDKLTYAILKAVDDPNRAAIELLRMFAFSYAIGNGDMHLKNISVWINPNTGEKELTPAYDLLSTFPYGDKKQVALSMDGKKANFKPGTFYNFGKRFGLDRSAVDNVLNEVVAVLDHQVETDGFRFIGYDANITRKLTNFIQSRVDGMRPAPQKEPLISR